MQLNKIRDESVRICFQKDIPQTHRLKKNISNISFKNHLGADTILLSWVLKHPAKVIPIAGTVNVAEYNR
jgi:predicted oxidoreductase